MRALVLACCLLLAVPALAAGQSSPGISPPGANDWSCRPAAAHPEPVVLVHGTFADMTESWGLISPALEQAGYCVYALDYGNRATGRIEDSAAELSAFVDRVLAATGAAKVDVIGHSQGGLMPRYYVKNLGGDAKVDDLVGLAPSNHGTTNSSGQWAQSWCPACAEQMAGSAFLTALNAGDESPGAVSYTQIETRYDEVVTPYTSAFLSGPGVTNVRVQDGCGLDASDHLAIAFDRRALRDVLNALDPAHAVAPPCVLVLPGEGG
jgi:triacylglycerol esterase/lipase EstA (alpha/beta hydrolase family)